jgi:hypothetical protein
LKGAKKMAGSVVVSVAPSALLCGYGGVKEILVSLTCLSDSSDGSIPDQSLGSDEDLGGLIAYDFEEIITEPGAGASAPETAYRVKLIDTLTSRRLFRGLGRSLTNAESQSGHEDLGYFPPIDGPITVTFLADDGDTEAAADIGNENTIVVRLRFVKRARQ